MRRAHVIAWTMLAGSALSWILALRAGDASAQGYRGMVWPYAAFGLLAAAAGRAHLAAAERGATATWKASVAGAVAIHLAAALALPLTSGDLWLNLAYGRMAALRLNPYSAGPAALPAGDAVRALVHPIWADLPMPYGPLTALLALAPGAAARPLAGMLLFKALMAFAALAAVLAAAPYCRARFVREEALRRFALFAWCPLLAWELTGQAHNDAVVVACVVGFVWAATSGRHVAAAALLTVGLATKIVVAPIAGLYLVALARARPLRAAALGAAMAAAWAATLLPWWRGASTLAGLWPHLAPVHGHASQSLGALVALVAGAFGDEARRLAFRAFSAVGVAALLGVAALGIVRTRSVASALHHALLFFLCADLFSQAWFQPWYLSWPLALALGHPDGRWLRLVAAYAALSLATYALPIDPVSSVAVDLWIGWRVLRLAREGGPEDVVAAPERGSIAAAA